MPGIATLYLRREPTRREGACRSYERREHKKKAAAFHNEAALSKIFVYDFNLCATGNHKTGGRIYV